MVVHGLLGRKLGVGELFDFWRTVSELNFDEIDREANKVVSIAVLGDRDLRERLIAEFQAGASFGSGSVVLTGLDPVFADSESTRFAHLLLFVATPDAPRPMLGEWGRLARRDVPKLLVLVPRPGHALPPEHAGSAFWGDVVILPSFERRELRNRLGPAVIRAIPDSALALARHLPLFRPAVSRWIIEGTARVNLEFALASNLPALLPVVGNLLGAAADLLVLTKNQIFMVYRLGVIHGRDTSNKLRVLGEIAPVVGAAFGWRTLARELAALVPGLIGAVPKVAIAYSGTYVVGRMAEYYYRFGQRPTGEVTRHWTAEALGAIRNLLPGGQREVNGAPALPEAGPKWLPPGARELPPKERTR